MSGSINKVTILGRLGADPEVRTFQNGGKVVNLRIATSETWKDKNSGEKQERTQWHQVVIFSEGIAGIAERFLSKGKRVYVEGQLETRKWQGQDGSDRYSTEIVLRPYKGQLVLIDFAEDGGSRSYGESAGGYAGAGSTNGGGGLDDDIPF